MRTISLLCAILLSASACTPERTPPPVAVDHEADILEVVDRFREAIVGHDSTMAASVLSPDVRILEGGAMETRHAYLSHHFHSDAAFLGAMQHEPIERLVSVAGDAAWVTSSSRLHGTFRDRDLDLTSLETLVLLRTDAGWVITSVHWSS